MRVVRSVNPAHGRGRVTHALAATFTYSHRMACGSWVYDVIDDDGPLTCRRCIRTLNQEAT